LGPCIDLDRIYKYGHETYNFIGKSPYNDEVERQGKEDHESSKQEWKKSKGITKGRLEKRNREIMCLNSAAAYKDLLRKEGGEKAAKVLPCIRGMHPLPRLEM